MLLQPDFSAEKIKSSFLDGVDVLCTDVYGRRNKGSWGPHPYSFLRGSEMHLWSVRTLAVLNAKMQI